MAIVEAAEAIRLLDRLDLLRSTIRTSATGTGYWSRETAIRADADGFYYRLAGQRAEVPADYPTHQQVLNEPHEIGRQLGKAAIERDPESDSSAFDNLAVKGPRCFVDEGLLVSCQSLRNKLEIELAGNGRSTGRRKSENTIEVERLLEEGLGVDAITERTGETAGNVRTIHSRMKRKT